MQRFPEQTVKFIAAQLILALDEVHKNGLTFNDLRLSNIIMTEDGYVKLTNFDYNKFGNADSKEILEYTSPESFEGDKGKSNDFW